ncbi:hypothetical protein KBY96_12270 [Cyanobium sp. ATX 6A2]|uniref:hypothetical protein n=1 Tax=Cyanobium sp. ATX 6A2 TaxID=2823700 RepID=UPI0020CBBBFD|nr:hypothetical protein [Cyanobium sp. ATX 6A2]MCP9888697.1 hypothetical protein [Cyanobium sp. ATX 6A2]
MEILAPFGFVTACHPGDKFMDQATLASMRHYCPEVPICLLADGDVMVDDLQLEYDLIVLRPRDLPDKEMGKLVSGNYCIKLAAMWEGPFEFYVWMDSDAIVWGDFTWKVRRDLDFQIFWSEVSVEPSATDVPTWLPHFYFDLDQLMVLDPEFEWRGWPYFSAGVYACRRNCFSFEDWQRVRAWNELAPDPLFRFGDQGQLNYMVHSAAQRGVRRVDWADLQYLVRHHGTREIEIDTEDCGWRFPRQISRPRVAHFPGQKPLILNHRAYSRAFTIARLEHYRRTRSEIGAWWAVWREEIVVLCKRVCARLRRASLLLMSKS